MDVGRCKGIGRGSLLQETPREMDRGHSQKESVVAGAVDECDTRDNATYGDNADEGSEVCMDSLDKQKLVISARRKVGNCGEDGDDMPTVMKAFLRSARTLCLCYIFNVITKICSALLSRIFVMSAGL